MPNDPKWGFEFHEDFLVADGMEMVTIIARESAGSPGAEFQGRGYYGPTTQKTLALVGAADRVWYLHAPDFLSLGHRLAAVDVIVCEDGSGWVVAQCTTGGGDDEWTAATNRAVGEEFDSEQ